jgi:endonuclease/exonuclease/phosphatase family metal-dependent hydrolase
VSDLRFSDPGTDVPLHVTMQHYDDENLPRGADGLRRLRLLSYNIQTGIQSSHYRHYFTQSWKHVLPYARRIENLTRIANMATDYDLVGLQEVDAGSLRTGFINQTEFLAMRGRFPYWYDQTNRSLGKLAQHSIGMLSRLRPSRVTEHKLPGRIPGRGVLHVHYGKSDNGLAVMILHLALSQRARLQQLRYVCDLINEHRNVILMGDLNCRSTSTEMDYLIHNTLMREPAHGINTFPSWRPERNIDHILVTPTLSVGHARALNLPFSDHLPVTMEIALPDSLCLTA